MRKATSIFSLGAALLFGGLLHVTPAAADTYIIDLANSGLSGASPGPYGTITTSLVGSAIHVVVTADSGFGFFGSGNGNGMFGLNVVDPDAGIALSNFSAGTSSNGSGQQFDGFGNFELSVAGPVAASPLTSFSFDVTRTAGFTNANQLAEVSSGGGTNVLFSAHVIDTTGTGQGITGFGANNGTTSVPEPTSLLLLGSGLAGMGLLQWKKRNAGNA